MTWEPIATAPENELVWTKIDDSNGYRNEQKMVRRGNLWFAGEMYVYYSPTHWGRLTEAEKMAERHIESEMLLRQKHAAEKRLLKLESI